MAEGLAKSMLGNSHNIQSAGSHASGLVHPNAILALEEIGIDISNNSSKNIEDLDEDFLSNLDYVITLCAEEVCPILNSDAQKLHWLNSDPVNNSFSETQLKNSFQITRENIFKLIKKFVIEIG
jgi:arsenate reductase